MCARTCTCSTLINCERLAPSCYVCMYISSYKYVLLEFVSRKDSYFSFYLSESLWRSFSTSLLSGLSLGSSIVPLIIACFNIKSNLVVPNQSLLHVLPGSWCNVYTLVCILRGGRVLNIPSLISLFCALLGDTHRLCICH